MNSFRSGIVCLQAKFLLVSRPVWNKAELSQLATRLPIIKIYEWGRVCGITQMELGKGRIVNTRFFAMTAHYLFDPDFCNVGSGWEKGVVEKNVQDARRRVWSEARKHKFSHFGELNAWLETQCRSLWATLPHPDYASLTIADVLEQEQLYMMPMPTPFDGYTEVLARVSSTCLVTVQRTLTRDVKVVHINERNTSH